MKVGIVGCGNIATLHLPHVLRYRGVDSVSLVDIDPQRAERMARQFKVNQVCKSIDDMFATQKPDVVHILVPPANHMELSLKAIEHGCHVLVEKPMALTTEEADAMIAAAHRKAVKLCVDHSFLYDARMMAATELVSSGAIGRVLHVESYCTYDMRRRQDVNAGSVALQHWIFGLPGGPLMDLSPHPLAILLQLLKNVERVWAVKKNSGVLPYGLPDEMSVLIEAEAATGSLVLSLGTQPDCFTVNIYGTDMTAHVNLTNMTLVKRKNRSVPKKISRLFDNFDQACQLLSHSLVNSVAVALGRKPPPGDLGAIIAQFYKSIEDDLAPPVSGEDGKAVVKLMNDIWQRAA